MVERKKIKDANLTNYMVAEKMAMSISNFYVLMQRTLTDEQKKRIDDAIAELTKEKESGNGER